ncbi:LysR family transcriptional regulator [Ideonella sp.]|uniref:LysR family transcriptional regulator n=1 Tax=Ideonella sp. TaxID=1929293 RepID=UPI002B4651C7|nr:LysR family transcriptional regulator [Ideonella sp.]HJV70444.1 LysR family transcriptional regulator [Ideonella sp.]
MRRKLPSTAALAAFEAAARHQSFTKAAAELAVTQSAVCRQIASLEGFLGVALFRRNQRGVGLTEAGQRYARSVAARLDEVERDTLDLMAQAGQGGVGGALELGVVPTFATQWLLPRLARFHAVHPGITVHLSSRTRPFLFADSGLDAAIHAGLGLWPGTEGRLLMPEPMITVASPALAAQRAHWEPADVARLPLLQASTRPYAWRHWFESLGLAVENDMAGPRLELFSMLSEAAAQGLGVALVPRMLVENELASGRLVQLLPQEWLSDRRYYLIYPEAKAASPALTAFANWLDEEATRYRAEVS